MAYQRRTTFSMFNVSYMLYRRKMFAGNAVCGLWDIIYFTVFHLENKKTFWHLWFIMTVFQLSFVKYICKKQSLIAEMGKCVRENTDFIAIYGEIPAVWGQYAERLWFMYCIYCIDIDDYVKYSKLSILLSQQKLVDI